MIIFWLAINIESSTCLVGLTIEKFRFRWNNYKSNCRKHQRHETCIQQHLYEHFCNTGHKDFKSDVWITVTLKNTLMTFVNYFVNYFVWILNTKVIFRGKNYGFDKFLWRDTRKESFMFWLRNWSYLMTGSSSSTLLLEILIFHGDISQSLFCLIICWIQQFHWLITLSNNLLHFGVPIFFNFSLKRKKISSTRKKNYCVFSRCVWAKLKIFLSMEKFLN